MSWPLRVIDFSANDSIATGDCWYDGGGQRWVCLPGNTFFPLDRPETVGRWRISGELPDITVQPSINCEGVYHGWITDGVISDDCEGRTHES